MRAGCMGSPIVDGRLAIWERSARAEIPTPFGVAQGSLSSGGTLFPFLSEPLNTPARPTPNPRLKGKPLRTPRQREHLTLSLTRSRIARPGRPETQRETTLLVGGKDVATALACFW
jgi:hypothetical protein